MPEFSVVIPTYNRSSEVKRAIESVLAQTVTDVEILVMDDGSTDDTAKVVAAFRDPRISYAWNPNFGGPARPRNLGIKKAKGKWICFLDADDWWMPNKLQVCLQHAHDAVDLIYHDLIIVREKPALFRRKINKSWQVKKPVLIDLLVNGNALSNSSVVVRKGLLDQIGGIDENPEMIATEDYNTWLRIAQITDRFCYIPESLGYYMLHGQGISQKDMSAPARVAAAPFMHLLSVQQQCSFYSSIKYMQGRHAFIQGNHSAARENLLFSARHGSFLIKLKSAWMLLICQKHRHQKDAY